MTDIPSLKRLAGEKAKESEWGRKLIRAKAILHTHRTVRHRNRMRELQMQQDPEYFRRLQQFREAKRTLNQVARQRFGVSNYEHLRTEIELPPELNWV